MKRTGDKDAHVDSGGDRAPLPDILPDRRVEREHGGPPEERQERGVEQHKEVRQEPRPRRDCGAVDGDGRLEEEEACDEEDGDDERREHRGRAPSGGRPGRDREDEEDQGNCRDEEGQVVISKVSLRATMLELTGKDGDADYVQAFPLGTAVTDRNVVCAGLLLRDDEDAERGDGHAHQRNEPEHPRPRRELHEYRTNDQTEHYRELVSAHSRAQGGHEGSHRSRQRRTRRRRLWRVPAPQVP